MDQTELWDTEFWRLSEQLRMWHLRINDKRILISNEASYSCVVMTFLTLLCTLAQKKKLKIWAVSEIAYSFEQILTLS